MTGMRRRYVDGPFGQTHMTEAGQGQGPTVLLLHQTPRTADSFASLLATALGV